MIQTELCRPMARNTPGLNKKTPEQAVATPVLMNTVR
jgi:hypothetical protein